MVAKELSCSCPTINRRLRKYNIPIKPISVITKMKFQDKQFKEKWMKTRTKLSRFDKILTKSFLKKEYLKNLKNTYQIAKKIGCSAGTINSYLKKNNIKARTSAKDNNCNWKGGRTLKKYYCKEFNCNNEICYVTYYFGQGRCGSCANINERNSMYGKKGKQAPSYIDGKGYEPYPIEFNDKLKYKIRKRDNFECQNCDMTEEEHLIVYGRVLEVHHIDYNKKNCKEENLITTCKQCNIRANYNRKERKNYFRKKVLN